MKVRMVLALGLTIMLCGLFGCEQTRSRGVSFLPPAVVAVETVPGPDGVSYAGQGVQVGSRVLTALHVFAWGKDYPPNLLLVNGCHAKVGFPKWGKLEEVRTVYTPGTPLVFSRLLQDWACFEILSSPPTGNLAAPVVPSRRDVYPGEELYACRYHPDTQMYEFVLLSVGRVRSEDQVPQDLVLVWGPRNRDLAEWSGCFVGRFDGETSTWELVGIYLGENPTEKGEGSSADYHYVLRPGTESLSWLFGGL